jgi:uncharacterized protein
MEHPDRGSVIGPRKFSLAGGGLPNADRQKVIDEILPVVQAGGDAARGKLVFKEQCGKCHMHSGDGGKVGPELTGMAVHPAHELLIHILDPNRSVEGNYRAYTVSTDDGRVVTGLSGQREQDGHRGRRCRGEAGGDPAERDRRLSAVAEFADAGGIREADQPEGFADLLAFLTKPGGSSCRCSLEKVATAVSTKGMFLSVRQRRRTTGVC